MRATDPPPCPGPSRWLGWGLPAVVLAGVLTYANAFRGDFVFDDILLVVNNDAIKTVSRVPDILFSNLWGLLGRGSNYYRPLPPLVFMALNAVFGLRPAAFHVVNILLHAGASGLVFLLARRLLAGRDGSVTGVRAEWPALAAALLFAVHPLHTEAVAWIAGIMDVACAFFSLLALWAYVRADDGAHVGRFRALSLAALFLALLSKEPAATVPALFILYDVLFRRDRLSGVSAIARRWGPAFGVFVIYVALRAVALRGVVPFGSPKSVTGAMALPNVPALFLRYVEKLILPVDLNVLHDLPPATSFLSPMSVAGLAVGALTLGLGVWAARREPVALFALAAFVLPLVPALYFPALSQDVSRAFAERYAYLPSAGLALLLAVALARVSGHSRAIGASAVTAVLLVSVVFSGMTLARNTVWKDSYSLWSDCVRKSPRLAVAHENLGLALMRRGQPDAARQELQAALRLDPGLPALSMTSGVQAARAGQFLQAVLAFQTALAYRPDLVDAHYNLAVVYDSRAWGELAMSEYRAALALDAGHADAHNNLGILLAERNRLNEAIPHFEAARRARPADEQFQANLARAYRIRDGR